MTIDGIEIPDWMARNNSREKLEKIIRTKYPEPKQDLRDAVSEDYDEMETFGIIVLLQDRPAVVAMGLTEDDAIEKAMILWEQDPMKALFIFQAEHISQFM
jgi:uncharacterized protein YqgQ